MQCYGVMIEQSDAVGGHRRVIGGGENLGFEAMMYGDIEAGVGVVLFVITSYSIHYTKLYDDLVAIIGSIDIVLGEIDR